MPKVITISFASLPMELVDRYVNAEYFKSRTEFIRMAVDEKLLRTQQLDTKATLVKVAEQIEAIPQIVRAETLKLLRKDPDIKKLVESIFDDK